LLVFLLFPVLMTLLWENYFSGPGVKKRHKIIDGFFYALIVLSSLPLIFGSTVLIAFNLAFAFILFVFFILLFLFSPIASPFIRGLFCVLAVTSFATSILIEGSSALQDMQFDNAPKIRGKAIRANVTMPGRRYRFVFDKYGKKVCFFFPVSSKDEVYRIHEDHPVPEEVDRRNLGRSVYSPDGEYVFALDRNTGPVVLSREDFRVMKEKIIPRPRNSDAFSYCGIAFRKKANELLVSRVDGRLYTLSWPSLDIVKDKMCVANPLKLFPEFLEDIYLIDEMDKLLVITFEGLLFEYDLNSGKVTDSIHMVGPLSNIVRSSDGKSFYIAEISSGMIYRINISDMKIIDKMHLATGIRYISILPERDFLLVSDYFHGEVMMYDAVEKRLISRVAVGPRIQWLDMMPDGKSFLVSHALGFTIVDSRTMMEKRILEKRKFFFPFYLARQRFLYKSLISYIIQIDGYKIIQLITIFACCFLFYRMFGRENISHKSPA
jgi:hypothetical protein